MKIRLLRHATTLLEYAGKVIIVDPMLSPAGAMDPVPGVASQARNPLVDLPADTFSALKNIDAIIVSHLHRDHFDDAARQLLPPDVPLFCQPGDGGSLAADSFACVQEIESEGQWQGIVMHRTGGQHGTGKIGQKMGPVSGFVLQSPDEPTVYIAGDTIWCDEVAAAIEAWKPQIIVCYAGEARFASGGPITMNKDDLLEVCRHVPKARVAVVHMEAWNHCVLTRDELRAFVAEQGLTGQVLIPDDGEEIIW